MNKKQHRFLVTGGAGFIGSELVHQLAEEHKVIVLDNMVNGKEDNLIGLGSRIELEVGDIRNLDLVTKLLKNVEGVFHLACMGVRHSIYAPYENHEVNAQGTLNLLIHSKEAGIKRFIHVSTSEVYGTARSVPMTELHPTFPSTVYGASKLAGECYARAFYDTYRFPSVIVRPFNTYGPRSHHEGDSGEVIPKFMLRAMTDQPMIIFGDGTQKRDFTFVSDTARGILLAGLNDNSIGQTINLGAGKEISIRSLAEKICRLIGKSVEESIEYDMPRPGDTLRLCADISLAKSLLGFQSNVSFEQGLIALRDWYVSSDKTPATLLSKEQIYNWKPGEK